MTADTTQLLRAARGGDRAAFDLLFSRVYDELRRIAHQRLSRYRPGETLDTTGLVHEAYLKLVDPTVAGAQDRAHFLALASRAMRFIVIDHARARQVQKRGGGEADLPLDEVQIAAEEPAAELLALDRALEQLSALDERQSKLVEYRFFGGLTYEEIAEVTGLSVRTVKRDWVRARTWLYTYMQGALS
jgi:RNA polymerase sigma factor (TIGR02999 family)